MDYKIFNLEKFEFWDDSHWITKKFHLLLTAVASLLKANPGIPPVVFKDKEIWSRSLSLVHPSINEPPVQTASTRPV